MKVLIIHLNPAGGLVFQIGLAYITSILELRGHSISFLFLSNLDKNKILNMITEAKINIIFISVTTDSFELCKRVTAFLHKKTNLPIFLGGIHPTISPDECIELEGVSGLCIGEGEYPSCDLVDAIEHGNDYTNIQNIWVKNNGRVYKNELRSLVQNLDELPFPNYEIFRKYFKNFKVLPVMLSRGCPFNCTYCCNNTFRRLFKGKGAYLRNHSTDYGIKLIKGLLKQFPETESIEFFDDTFTVNKERIREFSKQFLPLGVNFICNSRFDIIDEELVKLLATSGCIKVNAAIECGDEKIRREVLKRPISDKDIIEKSRLLKKYKIGLYAHNMVGVPYETEKEILKTIELNKMIKPDVIAVSVFNPYPKSDLGVLCEQKNWIDKRLQTTSFHEFTVLKTPYIKPHVVDYYLIASESMVYERGFFLYVKKFLYWLVHFRHNRAYLLLRRLKNKIRKF